MNPSRQPLSENKRRLLERCLSGEVGLQGAQATTIRRRVAGEDAPLSLAQEEVWRRAEARASKAQLYNESITLRRSGPLNEAALGRALTEVVRRHEIWRTTYHVVGGAPVQRIGPPPVTMDLPAVDVSMLAQDQAESLAKDVRSRHATHAFDLEHGPLVRALLIHLPGDEHELVLVMHQSVVDGVSVYQIVPRELIMLYEAFSTGAEPRLPALAIQYADYAAWQRETLRRSALQAQIDYWRRQLDGAPTALPWSGDFSRPPIESHRGAIVPCRFDAALLREVSSFCRSRGATLFTALFAAFAAVLHRYTGQPDIVIGTLAPSGRKRSEVKDLIGYFLNPVALRSRAERATTFVAMIDHAKAIIAGALSNDDIPIEQVVDALKLRPDPSRHPFFQVAITLAPPLADLKAGWTQSFMDADSGGARWDLYLEFSERSDGLMGRVQHNPDLFNSETVDALVGDIQAVLAAAALNPEISMASLPVAGRSRTAVP